MAERIIYHVDVNSAFLSWEAVFRLAFLGASLDLRTVPSAIGGDIAQRHGIILAKSIPAKAFGIQTGEPVTEALKKCPELILAPPNYGLYERCSKAFSKILKEYTSKVEPFSIDEVFMDMTETIHLYGDPVETANQIRERIKEELGFTVNIGVSSNKLLAKMASDFQKPDRVHTLFPDEIERKMWPMPVRELFFVGRATEAKLKKIGVRTIGQLARTDLNILRSHLKAHGETVWRFANGIDFEPVLEEKADNKGYGNSTTISFDVTDAWTAKRVLLALAETVGMRLRQDNVRIQEVSVGIKAWNLKHISHQKLLNYPTDITYEIYLAAAELFDEAWDGTPIRHLGIHTGKVKRGDHLRQITLFDTMDYEKLERVDRTIDQIRKRWGNDSIQRSVFLKEKRIDHLSGGISREKRSVDYTKLDIR